METSAVHPKRSRSRVEVSGLAGEVRRTSRAISRVRSLPAAPGKGKMTAGPLGSMLPAGVVGRTCRSGLNVSCSRRRKARTTPPSTPYVEGAERLRKERCLPTLHLHVSLVSILLPVALCQHSLVVVVLLDRPTAEPRPVRMACRRMLSYSLRVIVFAPIGQR